jgi:hypothetical protein
MLRVRRRVCDQTNHYMATDKQKKRVFKSGEMPNARVLPKKKRRPYTNPTEREVAILLYEHMNIIYISKETIVSLFGEDLSTSFEKHTCTKGAMAFSVGNFTKFVKTVHLDEQNSVQDTDNNRKDMLKGLMIIYSAIMSNSAKTLFKNTAVDMIRTLSSNISR